MVKQEVVPQTKPVSPRSNEILEQESEIVQEISGILEKTLTAEANSSKIEDIKQTLEERTKTFNELKKKLIIIQNVKKSKKF